MSAWRPPCPTSYLLGTIELRLHRRRRLLPEPSAGQYSPDPSSVDSGPLQFRGGTTGAIAPLLVFLGGVTWLGLSGAPDERGFWPIVLAALGAGVLFSRDSRRYCDHVIRGMAQPLVLTMVMAWVLAGVLGSLLQASGFVDVVAALSIDAGVSGGAFAVAAFLVAAVVSTGTGTSLGTLIVTVPVLYPVGVAAGVSPPVLIGALLGGATFGDNISPVSDTTIASAATQEADLGGVVRSRLKYALPAAAVAAVVTLILAGRGADASSPSSGGATYTAGALFCGLGPVVALAMLFRRRHLVESLLAGSAVTALIGLIVGTITPSALMSIDQEAFIARGIVLDGMQRAVGISIFTLLLMGVVAGIEGSGVVDRVVDRLARSSTSPARAEWSIFAAVSAAVIMTTHSVVAILTVGGPASRVGSDAGVPRYRRANILDVTVCTYPFLLPFFIPTILAASLTAADGMPRVSPFHAGLYNIHSWALLALLLLSLATGWGRGDTDPPASTEVPGSG